MIKQVMPNPCKSYLMSLIYIILRITAAYFNYLSDLFIFISTKLVLHFPCHQK